MEMDSAIQSIQQLSDEMQKHILGQEEVIEQILVALFSDGHILLE